jgi:hypothetical protein
MLGVVCPVRGENHLKSRVAQQSNGAATLIEYIHGFLVGPMFQSPGGNTAILEVLGGFSKFVSTCPLRKPSFDAVVSCLVDSSPAMGFLNILSPTMRLSSNKQYCITFPH